MIEIWTQFSNGHNPTCYEGYHPAPPSQGSINYFSDLISQAYSANLLGRAKVIKQVAGLRFHKSCQHPQTE